MTRPAVRIDAARTLVVIALAIVVGGYAGVARPLEARIADRYAALDAARNTIDSRRAVSARLARLLDERRQLHARIARFHLDAGRAASLDRLLGAAFVAANRNHAAIRAVQAASATTTRATAPEPLFDEVPLQLTLRGSYAALLATVRDLAAAPVAARITIDALAPDDPGPSGAPPLLATLGISLLHMPQEPHVRAEPR